MSKRIIQIGRALADLHMVLASVGEGCVCLLLLGLKVDLRDAKVALSSHLSLISSDCCQNKRQTTATKLRTTRDASFKNIQIS